MSKRHLDVHQLQPSTRYRVRRTFLDFYRNQFQVGEVLTFISHSFLPYHGGHTIVFKERTLYLQEDENADILESLHEYLIEVTGQ